MPNSFVDQTSRHCPGKIRSEKHRPVYSAEDAQAVAIKRVIAYQLAELMKDQAMTKVELAKRMRTSRAALDRLLDPENPSVTLQTLQSAASAVGGKITIALEV